MTIAFKRNLIFLAEGHRVPLGPRRTVNTLRRGTVIHKYEQTGQHRRLGRPDDFMLGHDKDGRAYLVWRRVYNGSYHRWACQPLDSLYCFDCHPVEADAGRPPEKSAHLMDHLTGTRN